MGRGGLVWKKRKRKKKTQDKSDFRPERKKADKVKGRCGCLEGKE